MLMRGYVLIRKCGNEGLGPEILWLVVQCLVQIFEIPRQQIDENCADRQKNTTAPGAPTHKSMDLNQRINNGSDVHASRSCCFEMLLIVVINESKETGESCSKHEETKAERN
jgi:hypothetical protein